MTGQLTGTTEVRSALLHPSGVTAAGGRPEVITATLTHLHRSGAVQAAFVGDADDDRLELGADDDVRRLRELLLLLREPGRLDVGTATSQYRAVFTGQLDIAVSVDTVHAPDVDRWLDRTVEAATFTPRGDEGGDAT